MLSGTCFVATINANGLISRAYNITVANICKCVLVAYLL